MECNMLFRLVLFVCVAVSLSGHAVAGLVITTEVTLPGHAIIGATIESSVSGDFTWELPSGYAGDLFAAVNSPWVTTITGATGAGAAWNGTYVFDTTNGNYPDVGIRLTGNGTLYAVAKLTSAGGSGQAVWTDGTRSFRYRLQTASSLSPSAGDPVEFNNISVNSSGLRFSSESPGGAVVFTSPHNFPWGSVNSINSTTSVVPEPSSIALMGLGGIGLCVHRMRRKRKRPVA